MFQNNMDGAFAKMCGFITFPVEPVLLQVSSQNLAPKLQNNTYRYNK